MTALVALCFHVVMLTLWSSSTAVNFAFCFLSVCIVLLFVDASGDKGEVSCEQNWFKLPY